MPNSAAADRRQSPAEPLRQHRLAASDQSRRSPAGRANRPRAELSRSKSIDARGVRLPPEVRIHYRLPTPDGGIVEETERMRLVRRSDGRPRENVLRPFSYPRRRRRRPIDALDRRRRRRAAGRRVDLDPPDSAGLHRQAARSPPSGTSAPWSALACKSPAKPPSRWRSADLCLENGRKIPAQLADDGCTFSVADVVEKSGAYWFDLTDREGLHGGGDDRWEILAVPDAPPTVHIEKPNANLFVTPQAVVPIRVSAKDDLALRNVALVFRLAESSPEQSLAALLRLRRSRRNSPSQPPPATAASIDYRWDLAPLNLQPGAQVTFYATADDYRPQTGKSDPRRLIVVTPDDLQDRIADREKLIVAELERALKMQRGCREQVESSANPSVRSRRGSNSPTSTACKPPSIPSATSTSVLTSRGEGVPMHVLALLADLENNGIDNADARRRIDVAARRARPARPRVDPAAWPRVDRRRQNGPGRSRRAGGAAAAVSTVAKSLAAVAERQDAIIASLEQQIAQLARWDGYRRLHREIGQLIRDQEDAARRTSEVGRRTLTRDLRDLSPQDAADLKAAAARQLELARLLDRVLQEADQATVELRKTDPLAAETVADALDEARRLAISGQMRAAAAQDRAKPDRPSRRRAKTDPPRPAAKSSTSSPITARTNSPAWSRSSARPKPISPPSNSVKTTCENRSTPPQRPKTRRLATASCSGSLATSSNCAKKPNGSRANSPDCRPKSPPKPPRSPPGKWTEAGQRAGQGDAADAARQAADAQRSLADARRQLADQLRQAAAELAAEQVARLEDDVKHLRRQQENALDEAQRLHGLEESQGQLTRSQALSLRDLARLQRSLQTDAAELAQRLSGAAAFELALTGAAADMGQAADSLDRRQIGPPTQDAQRRAIRQLDLLVEALKPEPPVDRRDQGSAGGDNADQARPARRRPARRSPN